MVWVLCGCKGVWNVVDRSGEVSIEVSAVLEGCVSLSGLSGHVKVVVLAVEGSR